MSHASNRHRTNWRAHTAFCHISPYDRDPCVPRNLLGLEDTRDQILLALQRAGTRRQRSVTTALVPTCKLRSTAPGAETPCSARYLRGQLHDANTTLSLVGFGSLVQPEATLNGDDLGTAVSIVDAVVALTDLLITGGRSASSLVTNSGRDQQCWPSHS